MNTDEDRRIHSAPEQVLWSFVVAQHGGGKVHEKVRAAIP